MVELTGEPMTWVMTGDSITQAVLHTHGARGWVEHVHERVRWQLDRLTDVVVNTGVSAWRARDVLAAYDHLIGRFNPDVLSISLGTNDARAGLDGLAEFRDSMSAIIARTSGAQIVLHTPVLVSLAGRAARAELPAYCQAVREIAVQTGALLVDHAAYWLARFPDSDPIPWLDDPAHPNAVGHRQMADHTLRTIGLGELTDV
ncbi:SGNH/GDSL hydrolase family protein [Kitasatospora sp. NBC_01266]|uniref:SGNH/GDSL hydrolase family protein n=1 Tax=Kitasatospora sp. NBC_01266 TaxID=2903572 RepID=UPI002E31C97F|nr:GDSL-type esterase/lipase family protein [Kitasatospora sp. NBC_01266]